MSWVSQIITAGQQAGLTPANIITNLQAGVSVVTGGTANAKIEADLKRVLQAGLNAPARAAMVTRIETMDDVPAELLGSIQALADPTLTEAQVLDLVQKIDQALTSGI